MSFMFNVLPSNYSQQFNDLYNKFYGLNPIDKQAAASFVFTLMSLGLTYTFPSKDLGQNMTILYISGLSAFGTFKKMNTVAKFVLSTLKPEELPIPADTLKTALNSPLCYSLSGFQKEARYSVIGSQELNSLFGYIGVVPPMSTEMLNELIQIDEETQLPGYKSKFACWIPEMSLNELVNSIRIKKPDVKISIPQEILEEYGDKKTPGHWIVVRKNMVGIGITASLETKMNMIPSRYPGYKIASFQDFFFFMLVKSSLHDKHEQPFYCARSTPCLEMFDGKRIEVGLTDSIKVDMFVKYYDDKSENPFAVNGIFVMRSFGDPEMKKEIKD